MSAKKESVTNIIKPLAAAFLTTEPEEEAVVQAKPQPRKSAPKPVAKPVEVKLGELTKEETRALLKEQLVSAALDEKPVKDSDAAEDDEVPFAEEKESEKKAAAPDEASVKEKEPEKKAAPSKKETVKKEATKKEPVQEKPVQKETAKKESAKKEPVPVKEKGPETKKAPKAEVEAGPEEELNIEYGGRSYSREDLVNKALKIWTSQLKRGRSELHNMELYVKPQENTVYYVFNGKRKGSFEL